MPLFTKLSSQATLNLTLAWGLLYGLLAVINIVAGVSHIISDVKRFQDSYTYTGGTPYPFMRTDTSNFKSDRKVVDSTAIEIEEES